ncbi:MAG TPA: spore coat U domain-containing protein [Kofleriaceae bacterium]|nr:spore coat U domain-containing protein [Kofleriaceae bacterium]
MNARLLAVMAAIGLAAVAPAEATAGSCTVTTVAPVTFGTYDIFDSAPVLSTGSIVFECSDLAPSDTVRIDLDGGNAHRLFPRAMIQGAFQLAYNLYLDAAHRLIWGDGTGGSTTYGPVHPRNGVNTVYLYGKIPPGQDVGAGVYTDTVTVTVMF